MPPVGIEPTSTMLQTVAMTTSAKAANLAGNYNMQLRYFGQNLFLFPITGFVGRDRTYVAGFKIAYAGCPSSSGIVSSHPLDALSRRSHISTCPALPGLTVFGFKAYAIVIYFVLLAALSHLLNATFLSTLNYNEIKLVCVAGFEPAAS